MKQRKRRGTRVVGVGLPLHIIQWGTRPQQRGFGIKEFRNGRARGGG